MDDHSVDLEAYVLTAAFDAECIDYARAGKRRFSSSDNGDINSEVSLWSNDSTSSTLPSVEPSPYDVPKIEAYLYYAGLSGPSGRGPKLVYRTSKEREKFIPPTGPEAYRRLMKLVGVPVSHKLGEELGKNCLWDIVREEVVKLLDKNGIQLTTVDLVRFRWTEKNDDQEDVESEEDEEDEENEGDLNYDDIAPIQPVVDGTVYTTPVTIWVGVKPDSTTGEQAHHAAIDILRLLKWHHVTDVEVAFRESEVKFSAGSELFAPVSDEDHLKDIIDNLSTALSLPIAGLKTKMQGTLGFYFRVKDDLYAVTARHVLFRDDDPNIEYNHVTGPEKEVIVMSTPAFTNYLASLQSTIGNLLDTAMYLDGRVETLTVQAVGDGPRAAKSAQDLPGVEQQLTRTHAKIDDHKAYFVKVKKEWSKPKDRVIGYVVWSPPISIATPPHSYTQDVCVIKLDKNKFRHFGGNVLSLGPEISRNDFKKLMHDRFDAPHEFVYPEDGLFKLRNILSEEQIRTPNNETPQGDPVRRAIKRGFTTLTTVGGLSGFLSHTRRYFGTGNTDSIEAAILPHSNDSGLFSRGGDSGSIIVDVMGRFVALLTGGTGKTDSSDITFGTPMHWLWLVILAKFPDANL